MEHMVKSKKAVILTSNRIGFIQFVRNEFNK